MKSLLALTIFCYKHIQLDDDGFNLLLDKEDEELLSIIQKDLTKPQELYNKIKEKRDNARLIRVEYSKKQDVTDIEKTEIYAEICTYNDILLLMESMFEALKNDK